MKLRAETRKAKPAATPCAWPQLSLKKGYWLEDIFLSNFQVQT